MTKDLPTLPDSSPPPSTDPVVIAAELRDQLQQVLDKPQSRSVSSNTASATPSNPNNTPPLTATTSSLNQPLITPSSTPEPGSRFSYASNDTPSEQSDLERRDSPASKHSSLYSHFGQGLINKFLHRHDPRPIYGPLFAPSQPIYWVREAGKVTPYAQVLDYVQIHQETAHLIKHVPHKAFDELKGSGLRITGDIVRVIHGTYFEHASVFIGCDISYHNRKVSQTKVRLDVSTGGLSDVDYQTYAANPFDHQPFTIRFAPRKHFGEGTDVDKATTLSLGGKLSGPSAITGSGINGTGTTSKAYVTKERHEIRGHVYSPDSKHNLKTVLEVKAKENPITEDGVHNQFAMGVIIVTRGKPVVVTLDISPTQNTYNKLRSVGAPKEFCAVPVWIGDTDWGVDGLPEGWKREMSKWNVEMWKHLVEYDVEGETVLIGK